MATIKKGILGGFKGKCANVVGSNWKGKAVMKSLPLRDGWVPSPKQVIQQDNFKYATGIAKFFTTPTLRAVGDRFAKEMSGYNRWMKLNKARFVNSALVDPQLMILGQGGYVVPAGACLSFTRLSNVVTAKYTAASLTNSAEYATGDRGYLVAMSASGLAGGSISSGFLLNANAQFTFDKTTAASTCYIYFVVVREDGSEVSNTLVYSASI